MHQMEITMRRYMTTEQARLRTQIAFMNGAAFMLAFTAGAFLLAYVILEWLA